MKYSGLRIPIFHSLYARLTIWVMLTVLAVFVIITLVVTLISSSAVLKGSAENAKSRMEIANQHINSVLGAVEVAVANTIPEVEHSLSDPDKIYDVVRRLLELNPHIIGSAVAFEPYYYPSKGEQFSPYAYRAIDDSVLTKQLGSNDYEYHKMDWYLIPKLQKKNCWSEPYFDYGGGEQMMTTYSYPLYDASGKMYAVITADVSLKWLSELLKESDADFNRRALHNKMADVEDLDNKLDKDTTFLYNYAYTYIIGKGGTYIAHPNSERILKDTYFTFAFNYPDSVDAQIGYEMIEGKSGIQSVNRDGTKFYINYAPIERTGWSMATVIPAHLIFARSEKFAIIIIGVMLLALILLFAVCRRILRRITRPLTHFAQSADEVARGNLNASLPQIKTHDEMKRLHDSFSLMQASLAEQMEELKHVNEQKGRIEGELKVASDIQKSMLPKTFPPFPERDDIDIFATLTPAKEVGGDLYDFFIRDNELFFCIGDVSGKGVPASLVMAVCRSLFRIISFHISEVNQIVDQINEAMTDQNDSNMFVTLFVGAMDLATGRLVYCNAGHDAPLIIDCKENRFNELPCESNLPVGVVPGWDFKKQEIDIPAGTMLFLFTDGLTEAEDDTHQLFDESRIHEVVRQSFGETELMPQSLIKCMDDAVHAFVGDAEQSDDLTMLAIKRPA